MRTNGLSDGDRKALRLAAELGHEPDALKSRTKRRIQGKSNER
jgi:hypothetical protein